ncbi:MAG: type II secretion system protein GspC [Kofleriaceae bacterium]
MLRWILTLTLLGLVSTTAVAEPVCKPGTGKITVRFKPDASLFDLGLWLSSVTCKNVVFGADVAKHATKLNLIVPNTPMTPKQAIQLFVDAVQSTGLVVKQKPNTFAISLGPKHPKHCPDLVVDDLAGGPLPPVTPPADPTPDPDAQALEDQVAKTTRRIDDTHYEIKQVLIDAALANPMAFMKGARVVPAMKDGKPSGFKLYAIRPSSVYARIGFANGDTLTAVNGYALTTPDTALEIYTKLRDAKKLDVLLLRRGKPVALTITIVK